MYMRTTSLSSALAVSAALFSAVAVAGPTPEQIFTAENSNPVFQGGYVQYGQSISEQFTLFKSKLVVGTQPFDFETVSTLDPWPIEHQFSSSSATPITATLYGGALLNQTTLGRYNTTQPTSTTPTPAKFIQVQTAPTDPNRAGDLNSGQFTITFDQAISAFAFFGSDIGDFDGSLYMDMYLGDARLDTLTVRDLSSPAASGGALMFYGFASRDVAYDKIVFRTSSPNGNDVFGFDDFWAADRNQIVAPTTNPVPEPGSLALVGLALFAAGWARKTQRRA